MKKCEMCTLISQKEISRGIFDMELSAPGIAAEAVPGQFVDVYCGNAARILPRPISLCGIDKANGRIRLVYRAGGKGTKEFSEMKAGGIVKVIGPLGNGFPTEEAEGKRVFLFGGGIGVPPMLESAKVLQASGADVTAVLGYKDDCFLAPEFEKYGRVIIATEDGSYGTPGNVLDAVRENNASADMAFACGPKPMLRAIKAFAEEKEIPCWVSLEERMACGIGACLACVCESTEVDEHSQVRNKRVCKDGPVFRSTEVIL